MKIFNRAAFYFLLAVVFAVATFPFFWCVSSSLRSGAELFSPRLIPLAPTLKNYRGIFAEQAFGRNILNSVAVAAMTVAMSLFIGISAAYALARREFRGRHGLLFTFLGVSMFPQVTILSGLFELIRSVGLYNSWLGLSISYMIFTLPFTVWILTTFMREIPKSLEEAAAVDGLGPVRTIFSIFLPLMGPALVTTGLLAFIAAWNEFLFALTLTLSNRARTVPVGISMLSGSSSFELPWGQIMAASVVVTIPIIVLVLVFQKKIISGLTGGAVKG